ncbi:MAG: bifunctional UDP-N-acetylglucosamine diphosphorylase/glucosamine-1-phosphate N-acetyltransferase GlmU [Rhizobiaceae bacterium]
MSTRTCLTIILAAGEGKRMASSLPKVVHPVAGLPMVCHVLDTAKDAGASDIAVVVGNKAELVSETVKAHHEGTTVHLQTQRDGTAHAVLAARDAVDPSHDDVVVLYGDVPLVKTETILAARRALAEGADIVVLGFKTQTPKGYGRLIVENGQLTAIREEKDASDAERAIDFCNSGIMAFCAPHMLEVLDAISNDNSQGEYYLTDAVEIGRAKGLSVVAAEVPEDETLGVNDRVQLAEVEKRWQDRKRHELMLSGVAMSAPQTVFLHHDTVLEGDVVLEQNIVFAQGVRVEQGAIIRAFSHLEGAHVQRNAIVGPYARLRPGASIGEGSKIGNFVEIKAATIGNGAKVNHLSYIGDADVGEKANIGAGAITCNYDGYNKYKTTIGAGAFIGTNTSLVAPVEIGENANTAAGSVITKSVPEDDLAIERNRQANLAGKAKSLRKRYAAAKAAKTAKAAKAAKSEKSAK